MTERIASRSPSASNAAFSPFAALSKAGFEARRGLGRLLAWQSLRVVLRLCAAGCMASLCGLLVTGYDPAPWLIVALPVLLALAALSGFAAERCQALAEEAVSARLREAASRRLGEMPAGLLRSLPAGALTIGLRRHPPAVASLVVGHRAAGAMMAAGPLLAVAALAAVSWQSALLVLLLSPVMIVFFALVGGAIQTRAAEQERSFEQLAGQFADRIRTLPTILANDALDVEADKLSGRLDAYVERTMSVLRLAFLNAGLIDFFASLSIAMLAVFLGLGHLGLATIPGFSGLALWQSLFVLMIAPEYFAPFRRFSEQYHAKAEGLAAAAALDRLLDAPLPAPILRGRAVAAASGERLPPCGLVVVGGPSGAGKSTLLRCLAGLEGPAGADLAEPRLRDCIWVATDSFVAGHSLAEAISADIPRSAAERLGEVAARLGLLDDALLPGGLGAAIAAGGSNLSGGQRLRIVVARALLSERPVIADEPTAKLDPETAQAVRLALREMAGRRLVVAASHDPALVALADRLIDLAGAQAPEAVA